MFNATLTVACGLLTAFIVFAAADAVLADPRLAKTQTGISAYYHDRYHGRRTASGEIYDKQALTAAHLRYPFGTRLRVTNLQNQKSVVVRVNDRGPYSRRFILDVSRRAARLLDFLRNGTARVNIEVLELGTP